MIPSDLIEGVVTEGGMCTMLGPSGSGKSTKALQMLYSLATGEPWLGQPVTKLDGTMGVLSFDMPADLMLDWIDGFPNVNSDRFSVVNVYNRGNPLGSPKHRALLIERWKAMNVEAIVIDSFSASYFHQDQNDAGLTQAHYRDLKKFALTEVGAKALIVIVHSTDKSPNKARGSTVHKDAASTQVVVSVDEKTDQRRVHVEKYRGARGSHKMLPVIVSKPDDVTHLVGLDYGAMTMASMTLPPSAIAQAFTDMPDAAEDPDTDSDEEEDL